MNISFPGMSSLILYSTLFCIIFVSSSSISITTQKSNTFRSQESQESQDEVYLGYKLIEGDMLIEDYSSPEAETETRIGDTDGTDPNSVVQNSGIVYQTSRWPYAQIPYMLSSDFGPLEREIINGAMNEIMSSTCIRFQEQRAGAGWTIPSNHYVYIQKHYAHVCNSVVGRVVSKSPQIMTLGQGCVNHWTVLHELLHVIGFYHEQNRWDRDYYVSIVWNNIQQGHGHDFQKQANSLDFGVGYDYKSILHYAPTHFGYAGRQTIESKPPGINFGNARHLSFKDKLKINRMYSCFQSSSPPSNRNRRSSGTQKFVSGSDSEHKN